MASRYPGNLDSYTRKSDGVDVIMASHINQLQDAIVAIEEELGANPRGDFSSVAAALEAALEGGGSVSIPTLDRVPAPVGDVSLAEHRLTDVASPVAPSDGATKGYVDGRIPAPVPLDRVPAPVGDVSLANHRLTSVAPPVVADDAATKGYVDGQVPAPVPLDQIPAPVGDVSLASHRLTSVGAPVASDDGATKGYVDTVEQTMAQGLLDFMASLKNYAPATGSANTYAVTLTPGPSSLGEGLLLLVRIPVTNTGASTLDVNGLGAVTIRKQDGSMLGPGALQAGGIYPVVHDGVFFQVMRP